MSVTTTKKPGSPSPATTLAMRETLFGDLPWDQWPASPAEGEPWTWFKAAREQAAAGHKEQAVAQLRQILSAPGLESRHYLQAWHFLRQLGAAIPPEQAKHVYGMILEVGLPEGPDLLAAFEDGSARYWNYTGHGIVWDIRHDPGIDPMVRELLRRGSAVAAMIGPWEGPRPPPVDNGTARLNMLTSSGLHFGQGPMDSLLRDPHAGGILNVGAHLMKLLIEKVTHAGPAQAG